MASGESVQDVLSSASKLASYNMVFQEGQTTKVDMPPMKKPRMSEEFEEESNMKPPQPVLSDDLLPTDQAIGLVDGLAAPILEKKETQNVLKFLTEKYPLPNMPHVKRVRSVTIAGKTGTEVLVMVRHKTFKQFEGLFNHIKSGKDSPGDTGEGSELDGILPHLGCFHVCKVASIPPVTRQQFDLSKRYWPVAYHEDKHVSLLLSGSFFQDSELSSIADHMRVAFSLVGKTKCATTYKIGAVVVDPKSDKVVASAIDLRTEAFDYLNTGRKIVHSLQHAVMVAIDLVAKTQGGGTYSFPDDPCLFWDRSLLNNSLTKDKSTSTDITVGSHASNPKCDSVRLKTASEQPYICTGYDIYVTHEPCVMCAMALLHSRIRRVFYTIPNPESGALGGRYKLHCMKELNHRFLVFKC